MGWSEALNWALGSLGSVRTGGADEGLRERVCFRCQCAAIQMQVCIREEQKSPDTDIGTFQKCQT